MTADPQTDDLARLLELAEKATPGPWEEDGLYVVKVLGMSENGAEFFEIAECSLRWNEPDLLNPALKERDANAAFIAAANPETVKRLCERVRKSEAEQRHCPLCDSGLMITEEEAKVVADLSRIQDLRPAKIWTQALKTYELIVKGHSRLVEINPEMGKKE